MRLLLFVLCLSSYLCFVYCEAKHISVHLRNENKCEVINLYRFKIGDTAEIYVYKANQSVNVTRIHIIKRSEPNDPKKVDNTYFVNVPLTFTVVDFWTITIKDGTSMYTCEAKIAIDYEENIFSSHPSLWIAIAVLFTIIIAETCGLICLTRKVKRLQEPGRQKCIEDRPETPLSEDRYIKDPVLRNKKIIENNRDSEIYDIPDITIGDQGTLKSNISITQRPPIPIPDEDVYLEPGEVLNDLPPPTNTFDTSGRSKPNKKPNVLQEKQMRTLPIPIEPMKPNITPAMLNRFQNNEPHSSLGRSRDPLPDPPRPVRNIEPSPSMARKPEPKSTLGRNRECPMESPVPARKIDLKSSLGRSRDPLPDPPGQIRINELKKSTLGRRGPLPDPPGSTRNIEPQSSLGRSRDPLPNSPGPVRNDDSTFPRNRGVQMPPAQYPIPGPSNMKKPLKPTTFPNRPIPSSVETGQVPIMPVPGPEILKKPLKPVPPPNRPKPQPPKEHQAPFSNRLILSPVEVPLPNRPLPPSVEVPVSTVPKSPSSLDEQVKIFNEQRQLEVYPTTNDDDDDEWETYEPLDQRNLYSV